MHDRCVVEESVALCLGHHVIIAVDDETAPRRIGGKPYAIELVRVEAELNKRPLRPLISEAVNDSCLVRLRCACSPRQPAICVPIGEAQRVVAYHHLSSNSRFGQSTIFPQFKRVCKTKSSSKAPYRFMSEALMARASGFPLLRSLPSSLGRRSLCQRTAHC
jgi:hypothetical protein